MRTTQAMYRFLDRDHIASASSWAFNLLAEGTAVRKALEDGELALGSRNQTPLDEFLIPNLGNSRIRLEKMNFPEFDFLDFLRLRLVESSHMETTLGSG